MAHFQAPPSPFCLVLPDPSDCLLSLSGRPQKGKCSLDSSPSSHNCLCYVTWRHTRRRVHRKERLGSRCTAFRACEVAFQRNGYFKLIFSASSFQFCCYTRSISLLRCLFYTLVFRWFFVGDSLAIRWRFVGDSWRFGFSLLAIR
jgi:hypothetical protein